MPYIKEERRKELIINEIPRNAGELNYMITMLVKDYLNLSEFNEEKQEYIKPDYQKFNDALGALEGSKLELYRRMVAPYEDFKKIENGDVF